MGSNRSIEFDSGTISINGGEPIPVKDFTITEFNSDKFTDEEFNYIKNDIDQTVELTGRIDSFQLTFGARVMLFGFWRTVRAEIRRIFGRLRNG